MRAIASAVVLSSLLVAAGAVAIAGPGKGAGSGSGSGSAAGAGSGSGSGSDSGSGSGSALGPTTGNTPTSGPDYASVKPEDMPTDVRMRRLEQSTQALKERAWQLKARVQMLREQMLGGGVGAQAVITHSSDMGGTYRLVKITYSLDGTQVFQRDDATADNLYKTKGFDVFTGPIAPGNHNITAVATYRGHGYSVFDYLDKYTFTARGSNSFVAAEGKIARVECRGYEKGGASVPMEKRAAIDCKVTQVQPEKAPDSTKPTTPGQTPMPATTPSPGQ